jgi:hypothetical protein
MQLKSAGRPSLSYHAFVHEEKEEGTLELGGNVGYPDVQAQAAPGKEHCSSTACHLANTGSRQQPGTRPTGLPGSLIVEPSFPRKWSELHMSKAHGILKRGVLVESREAGCE